MSQQGYKLKLGGSELPEVLATGVQWISVSESLSRLDEFEIKFYVPAEELEANCEWHGEDYQITVHAAGHEARTLTGEIIEVGLQRHQAAIQLVLRGVGKGHKLKRTWKTKAYEGTHSDVAEMVGKDAGKTDVEGVSGTAATYLQANVSHATFVNQFAKLNNYAVRVGTSFRFGRKASAGDGASADIEWGDISGYKVTHSLDSMVTTVKVVGYDAVKAEVIKGEATASDAEKLSGGSDTGPSLAQSKLGEIPFELDNTDVTTTSEADAIAKGELQRRADTFLRGSFVCSLNPDAVSGGTLNIMNAPWPIKGKFLIEEVTHVFPPGDREYTRIQFMSDGLPSK